MIEPFDRRDHGKHADPVDIKWASDVFSGINSMSWDVRAGQVREFWIIERSKVETFVNVLIVDGTVAGTVSTDLYIRLPYGKVAAHRSGTRGFCVDGGTVMGAIVWIESGSDRIAIRKLDGTNWTAGAVSLEFQLTIRTVAQP